MIQFVIATNAQAATKQCHFWDDISHSFFYVRMCLNDKNTYIGLMISSSGADERRWPTTFPKYGS